MTAAYLEHLSNVRSATLSMSEDCLYLNIFSPNKAQGELIKHAQFIGTVSQDVMGILELSIFV